MKVFSAAVSLLLALMLFLSPGFAAAEESPAYTDVVILSTTDMHGKCWETNILTGDPETHNLLRISTAVESFRQAYGRDHVLLIDNGDLYQGTQVSEYQLMQRYLDLSDAPPVMALCLKEMGYTASVLGNHEFNFPWELMQGVYRWLEENGVPVLAANVCHDGTQPGTEAGQNAFTPYVIRTVTVNGHEHKIGILGLENADITRWDLPEHYPGLQFVHPGNDSFSMAEEAALYLPEMKAAGCEFIILSYHGGLGDADSPLVFGVNTEHQARRLIAETRDVDLLINGHDHSSGYSGSTFPNTDGREIPVLNGGSTELARAVFRFSEKEDGSLAWELLEAGNLDPSGYAVDERLQELIRPYAEMTDAYVEKPVGTIVAPWDSSRDFKIAQTASMDLVSRACMEMGTLRIAEMAEAVGADTLMKKAGTDHLDVDLCISTAAVAGDYAVTEGPLSIRDIYRLCRFSNSILVLPMKGAQIRAVLEENASSRLTGRARGRQAFFYTTGDKYTNLIFGGLNFTYDLAKPDGEKVIIRDFFNGRTFDDEAVYLVAVNNYILGNANCGLRDFSSDDALWAQMEERGETVQSLISQYMILHGSVSSEDFPWHWDITWSGSMENAPLPEEEIGAEWVSLPQDGQSVVIFSESGRQLLSEPGESDAMNAAACQVEGALLKKPLPAAAQVFTVRAEEDGSFRFLTPDGKELTAGHGSGLGLSANPGGDALNRWLLKPARGGWFLVSAGNPAQAVEFYNGQFNTYTFDQGDQFILNFYRTVP